MQRWIVLSSKEASQFVTTAKYRCTFLTDVYRSFAQFAQDLLRASFA
jgi:hypothetical protein